MCKRLIVSASVLAMVLAGVASAVVVDGYQEWTARTQLADIGGLEITATGHAKFTARVDQDAVDVTIAAGGILESQDMYKLPDEHPEPTTTNVYVNGTWNANNIESKGTTRAAYIYVGAAGVINIQIGYGGTAPYENPADYDPQTWLADNSLLVDPSLDPAVWFIQITDMGGGAAQITAEALAPQVGFDSPASGDLESVSPAELTVTLSGAEEGQTYTVDYAVTGGTAEGAGVDYTLEAGTLTFNPGETTQTISIDIVSDGLDEEDETIVVELSNPTGPDILLADTSEHTYTILDPRPAVAFDADSGANREDVSPVEITVSLSFASDETVTVNYAVTGGTATGGVDYTLDAGTLTFNAGETTKTISLAIANDGVDEQNETILITLSNPANAKLGAITQFTYTIIDPSSLDLKIDFALPIWTGTEQVPDWEGVPIPETLKEGWIPWCAGRWGDMYGHGTVAMENVAGTEISTMVSTVYGGLTAVKVCGMCMPELNGGTPYGSPVHDPICNSWLQVEDHPENPSGDIVMALYNLPSGEYELYSYHNNFECHRNTPACCDLIANPQPPMPSITALSINGLVDRYAYLEWWPRWLDTKKHFINCQIDCCFWDHPVGSIFGNNVTTTLAAYDVPVQQVTQDSQLVPSLIKFRTDGSAVFIVYESGCCVPDGIRPSRVGGRAILNAFELILLEPAGCRCLGDVSDPTGFGTPDGKVDIGDLNALLLAMLDAYPDGDATGVYDIDPVGLPCGADCSDTSGFGDPDGKVDIGDLNALLFAMLSAYPDGDPTGIYEVPCL